MDCVTVRNLSFSYPGQDGPVLRDVSFALEKGEFAVLCGPSGCGKSTLLRQLKSVLTPHGDLQGEILFEGRPLQEVEAREQAAAIGFVQQSPDNQLVTDKVWHELAFGLENLGVDRQTMRSRIAEMAAFFGIEPWFHREVSHLSGGQKQTLSLAAVMLLQPRLLLLDEPTSQLDPVAASAFLTTLSRLNRELGVTVLLVEQRLEEALPLCDRVLLLDKGRLAAQGSPAAVGQALCKDAHGMFEAMPTAMRVWAAADGQAPCPVTVREGRAWLAARAQRGLVGAVPCCQKAALPPKPEPVPALRFDRVWFGYDKKAEPLLRELSLTVPRGQALALMGGNGAGKSTLLWLAAGLYVPLSGKVTASGKVGLLPQQVQSIFVRKTLEEELFEALPSARDAQGRQREALFAQKIALWRRAAGWKACCTATPSTSPEGNSSARRWPRCCCSSLIFCCLTSPPRAWTRGLSANLPPCSGSCAHKGQRFSWSAMTWSFVRSTQIPARWCLTAASRRRPPPGTSLRQTAFIPRRRAACPARSCRAP